MNWIERKRDSVGNFIITFTNDTLKVRGKFSMKRVLVAIVTPYGLNIGNHIVTNDSVNAYAILVFQTIFAFITAVLITSAYAKKQELKDDNTNNTE